MWLQTHFVLLAVFILCKQHKNDGKTLGLLAKRASAEQYKACGLLTVADQLKLSTLINAATDDDRSTGFEITTIKPKPLKVRLNEISETPRRIYKTK